MNASGSATRGSARSPLRELDQFTFARAARGDRDAFRALVTTYQSPIFALLSRILRPAGLDSKVEDLAQETFVRVFNELDRFDYAGPAKPSTWMLTIATRLALDELRRERVRASFRENAATGVVVLPHPSPSSPERRLAEHELGASIEAALGALAPEVRAAFVLRAYHELSYEEIATSLGCDLGTVKSRIGRARNRIRTALEATDGGVSADDRGGER